MKDDFDNNGEQTEEQKKFYESHHIKNMIQKVNSRLGFDGTSNNNYNITTLSFEDIMIMYKACVYQKGFHPDEVSTFCAAFSEEDLKVI